MREPCWVSRRRYTAPTRSWADLAFVEAPQTLEEVSAVPRLVQGPCLLNIVWRGKTPDVSLDAARAMGYRLAILPAVLLTAVIGVCDAMLRELQETRRHPVPPET